MMQPSALLCSRSCSARREKILFMHCCNANTSIHLLVAQLSSQDDKCVLHAVEANVARASTHSPSPPLQHPVSYTHTPMLLLAYCHIYDHRLRYTVPLRRMIKKYREIEKKTQIFEKKMKLKQILKNIRKNRNDRLNQIKEIGSEKNFQHVKPLANFL